MRRLWVMLWIMWFLPSVAVGATIGLIWDAPVEGVAPDGYRMYRSEDSAQTFVALQIPPAKLAPTDLDYDDVSVIPGKNYCYAVVSTRMTAESSYSNVVCGYVPVVDTGLRAPLNLQRRN